MPRRASFRLPHFLILLLLLAAPGWAMGKLSTTVRIEYLAGAALGLSVLTFALLAFDKRRAERQRRRISESTLHVTELLGGWPGSFVAQRLLRHKTARFRYQVAFWLIVLAHQFVAVDFVLDWTISRSVSAKPPPAQSSPPESQ